MKGLSELDRVLRGDAAPADGRAGPPVALLPLLGADLLLASFYGVCMGVFALAGRAQPEYRQVLADAVKIPLLFLLTLFVTFPSLYVFNALVGSRLTAGDLARLTTAGLGVLVAVLAAFGPIVGFFSVTTTSYPFVLLLNVAVFALAGGFGLSYLVRTVDHLLPLPAPARPARARRPDPVPGDEGEAGPVGEPAAPTAAGRPPTASPAAARTVLYVWLVVFALVGAQMSWVLRPFVGAPDLEFTWFRPRESSFFEAVLRSARMLFLK